MLNLTFLSLLVGVIDSFQPHAKLSCSKKEALINCKLHSRTLATILLHFTFLDGYETDSLIKIIMIEIALIMSNAYGMK